MTDRMFQRALGGEIDRLGKTRQATNQTKGEGKQKRGDRS